MATPLSLYAGMGQMGLYRGKKLKGRLAGKHSLRVSSYRIICEVHTKDVIVWALTVSDGRETCRS